MNVTLEDYASTEKMAWRPKKLVPASPKGFDPDVGDIAYHVPWGHLAIFERDFDHAVGLVRLGRLDSNVEALSGRSALEATIEPAGRCA